MKNKNAILVVAVVLAVASFAFARHSYVAKNTTNIANVITIKSGDQHLFGNWVKEESFFAIILPLLLLAGGAFAAFRK